MPEDCQPTTFVIGQADPAAQMCAEDAVLFNQIREARLPLVGPSAGHDITNNRTAATSMTAGVYLTR
jgi:hypothetical protein